MKFHIDIILENKDNLKPDNISRCKFYSETNNTVIGIQRDSTAMPNLPQESELLKDAVSALMDLDPVQCTQDDKSVKYDFSHTKEETHTEDLSVKFDHSYYSEDSSKSDCVVSDDDIDNEFYNIKRLLYKCQLVIPDQEIYHKDWFIIKVIIEMLLLSGNKQSSHATSKSKYQHRTVSNITPQDVQFCAICVANISIQKGNIRSTSAYEDDP